MEKFTADVVDTDGKFASSVVVHLDLRIFEKIRNDHNIIFRGWGEDDSWKQLKA